MTGAPGLLDQVNQHVLDDRGPAATEGLTDARSDGNLPATAVQIGQICTCKDPGRPGLSS